jgi:branched-chain amino acid transport system permease protein
MDLAQSVVNGLLIGSIYALIAVGLTLVYGVMDIVNFAHGEFLMLGMFGGYVASTQFGIDPLLAAPVVGLVVFALGALVERSIIEPIIKAPPVAQVMATVGLGLVMANAAAAIVGNDFRSVQTSYQGSAFTVLGLSVSAPYLYAGIYALVVALLLAVFLNRTDFGKAMRATAQNRGAAELIGINPKKMYMTAFGIGVGLAALAGSAIVPYALVYPYVGQQYVLIMFTVVVLGGLGSVRGAILAGLTVGLIQSLTTLVLPTELQNLVVFSVFFAVLVLIPGGVMRRVRGVMRRVRVA